MGSIASGDWLTRDRVRAVGRICVGLTFAATAILLLTRTGTLDLLGRPIGTDFSGVWTAGRMALAGQAPAAWDWDAHRQVQEQVHGAGVPFFGWHYPPPFLLVASVLSTMPYLLALAVWQAGTLAACVLLLRRIVADRDTWLLVLGAPVTLICLAHGHNGFLTGTLLGGGLLLLERRPWLAGVLLGCLLYKPQFAVLIGPLLLVCRNWRAIGGALLSSAALVGLTLLIWGWPVWQAFLDSLPLTRTIVIEAGATGFHKIMSPFAAVRLWGAPVPAAYGVQTAFTLAAIAAALWTAQGRPFVRNAAVCAATVIATPYVLDYDHVVVGVGLAFLVAEARSHGWRRYEKSAAAVIWFAPLIARTTAMLTGVPLGLLSALLLLGLALRRVPKPQFTAWPFRRSRAASGQ